MPRKYKKRKSMKKRKRRSQYKKRSYRKKGLPDGAHKGRVVPFSKLYYTPFIANQTIDYVIKNEDEFDVYTAPSGYQQDKVDVLTNAIFVEGVSDRNLQQCFETIGTIPPMNDFRTFITRFQWIRFKWIKVMLTPENYRGVGDDLGQDSHPILHVINERAEFFKCTIFFAILLSIYVTPSFLNL